ncbi:MAG TPA: SAM-dependent methyltransferase [Rhodospirillaceae bacterium]|nr:SAM-dependent methyltransferase [Rhodospirillaceae bacterium]MAX64974.1 SAM-dependent methyltransferase [Rhodospirillaceae bacterium]MBB57227.1 SAM-dependent methyltransferase [Rhodospirillaceae bacterium]HAE02600.1 SAM-dependent methyltransferase [Rhodospirillaceae bacterium]HBM12315.1 SAM-dependent methyltransferase [Rhodospirillaceae bacterium]|tara:strand:+ start:10085 stop:10876 length:792 start_codon:yes stop_codon:yes gene_type:complete
MKDEETLHYPDSFINALQAIWGDGFLSPGGPEEIAAMLDGLDITGLSVLDIGCGVGGIDCLLVQEYGASQVTAIDVEPQLIDHASRRFHQHDLSHKITAHLVEPGPLPFADNQFDSVFSKDAMLHIPEKHSLYKEVLRVLKPGGQLIASDWLRGGDESDAVPPILVEWGEQNGLKADFATPAETEDALRRAGFQAAHVKDRNAWYREEIKKEELQVTGPGLQQLIAAIGMENAEKRVRSYEIRQQAVNEGALRPCHLYGMKPA